MFSNSLISHTNSAFSDFISVSRNHLSKGQKKRLERKNVIMQKIGIISPNFRVKKSLFELSEEKNKDASLEINLLAADNSCESMTIDEKAVMPAAVSEIRTNKMRKTVAIRETNRMKLVQNDPGFIRDPIAAVTQHLQKMIKSKKST